jgi:predicted O-methyltransferase YrrM
VKTEHELMDEAHQKNEAEALRIKKAEQERVRIDKVCPGWSTQNHWFTFEKIIRELPEPARILVLGVYRGRDVAYMASILRAHGRRVEIVGVDKFEDSACADWDPEKRGLTWKAAGFGDAPDVHAARGNLAWLGLDRGVELVPARAEEFLRSNVCGQYDLIYIDTSHDYDSTREAIVLSQARLRTRASIVAGDDFYCAPQYGVVQAVRDSFGAFQVEARVWWARGEAVLYEKA